MNLSERDTGTVQKKKQRKRKFLEGEEKIRERDGCEKHIKNY